MKKLQKPFQGSVDEHLQLLRSGSIVLQQLVNNTRIQNNKAPTMFHSGLHKRNVFVSEENPVVVTGFIDWQLTRIEPAFYYADDVPDFATLPVSNEETQTNKSARVKELESLCSQAYVAGLALLAPRMNAARSVNETLLRPFRYCHRTWRDSLVLHMSCWGYKNWDTLGFKEPCALSQDFTDPDSGQAHVYREREEMFNNALEIKEDLLETVGTDDEGWVLPELLEEQKSINPFMWNAILCDAEDQKDRNDLEACGHLIMTRI